MEVILASASPRRKQLLSKLYEDFKVMPSDIRELVPRDLDVEKCPEYLACAKAEMVSQGREKCLVIGCDTAVICEGKMLNKPRDTNDARIIPIPDVVNTIPIEISIDILNFGLSSIKEEISPTTQYSAK